MKKLSSNILLFPVLLSFIILLFFIPGLISGKIPIPADSILGLYHPWRDLSIDGYNVQKFPVKNPLTTDPVIQIYPWRKTVIDNIKEGFIPLWNPYSFSGQPLLANIQSSPFQFSNFLFIILPFNYAWAIQIILPVVLTGLFTYFFLRRLKLSQIASLFGSFVLPFSGFFVSWQLWGTIIASAMWLPLILLSAINIASKISPIWFLIIIIAVSQTIFSGHWQTALYVLIASTFYIIYLFYLNKNIKSLIISLLAISLGVFISAIQSLPSLEFISLSARDLDQNYFIGRQDWFLPIQHLAQIAIPDFFGNPTRYNYYGIWNYGEFVTYIGVIPLIFALIAIIKPSKKIFFFIFLSLFSLLFMFENPISKLIYLSDIPIISSTQPSRIIFLFVFSLSILAAFGFDDYLNKKFSLKLLVSPLVIISFLLLIVIYSSLKIDSFISIDNINPLAISLRNSFLTLVLIIFGIFLIFLKKIKVSYILLSILIILVTLFDLFRFGSRYITFSKLSWIFPETSTTEFLKSKEKPFRIISTDRRIFNGNTPAIYSIESVSGYDPLFLRKYATFVSSWESNKKSEAGSYNRIVTPQNYNSKIASYMNVDYIVTFDVIESDKFTLVNNEGLTNVYKNNEAFPRFFFVNEIVKLDTDSDVLSKLFEAETNLRKSAFSTELEFSTSDFSSSLEINDYSDQLISIHTKLDRDAPLVSSNIFYPGWKVYIDGNESKINTVNFMFQGLIVPEGEHQLEFKFEPQSFYNGAYVSASASIISILAAIFIWRRKFQ